MAVKNWQLFVNVVWCSRVYLTISLSYFRHMKPVTLIFGGILVGKKIFFSKNDRTNEKLSKPFNKFRPNKFGNNQIYSFHTRANKNIASINWENQISSSQTAANFPDNKSVNQFVAHLFLCGRFRYWWMSNSLLKPFFYYFCYIIIWNF